jgi:myo-inositol-1(or 4)-monophosphatase
MNQDKNLFNTYLLVAERACKLAGEEIKKIRQEGFTVKAKTNDSDIVTTADLAADKIVREYIYQKLPTHNLFSEESFKVETVNFTEPTWILDPVDGTTNFAHGIDHFSVSLALVINNELVVGVVYAPALNECYTAALGEGAYLNNLPIKCANSHDLKKSVIATGFPYLSEIGFNEQMSALNRVARACRDVRRFGACSLDLCYVAKGVIGGFYESVYPWDIAAGMLIAKEAGAQVGHSDLPSPKEDWVRELPLSLQSDNIIVAEPTIFNQLKELIY